MKKPTGMIECHEALSRLWALLDGELTPSEQADVRRHLEVCDRCFPEYDFQRAYRAYLRRLAARNPAPSALRSRIFRGILEQEAVGEG